MAHGTQKVYVIKRGTSTTAPDPQETTASPGSSQPSTAGKPKNTSSVTASTKRSWKPLITAYLLGPVTVSRWVTGPRGAAWAAAGAISVFVAFLLAVFHSRFDAWLGSSSNGVVSWFLIVPLLVAVTGTVWARSVTAAGRRCPATLSRLPRRLRSGAALAALGALIPGLGLMLTGRVKRAGWAFALVIPAGVTAAVLLRWQWLWDLSRSTVSPGLSGATLEIVLLSTVSIAAVCALAWIVQALDGARHAGHSPSHVFADAAGAALIVSLIVFAAAFRPVTVARNLNASALPFRHANYRLIPLAVTETASWLDPANPVYIAEAAELYRALGNREKAREKRDILEQRAAAYTKFAWGGPSDGPAPLGLTSNLRSTYIDNARSPCNRLNSLAHGLRE
jgi:hypothetical protein